MALRHRAPINLENASRAMRKQTMPNAISPQRGIGDPDPEGTIGRNSSIAGPYANLTPLGGSRGSNRAYFM